MSGPGKQAGQAKSITTSRSSGQASTFSLLVVAAAVGGWFYWRKRKADLERRKPHTGAKSSGGRSRFRFPGARNSSNSNSSTVQQQGSRSAFKFPQTAVPAAARAGGARKGNPKKQNKKQRRAEKEAKKEVKGKGMELIHNTGIQGKEEEGPVTVKYVDLDKTAEVYDRVREYQETGKKRY